MVVVVMVVVVMFSSGSEMSCDAGLYSVDRSFQIHSAEQWLCPIQLYSCVVRAAPPSSRIIVWACDVFICFVALIWLLLLLLTVVLQFI